MSKNFTVRLPEDLIEAMRRHKEVNWSQVIRDSIVEYLKKLDEMERIEDSNLVLERIKKLGVKVEALRPLDYEAELKLYRKMVLREWRRIDYTTQA